MSAATDLELYKCATLQVLLSSFFFQSALFAVEREKKLAGGRPRRRWKKLVLRVRSQPTNLEKSTGLHIFLFFSSFHSLFFCLFIISFILSVSTGFGNLFAFDSRSSASPHSPRSVSGGRWALSASFGTGVEARQ
jgi:hypothetical protein